MPNLPLIVYVDVDDTLIRSAGNKRIPIPAVIEHIRALHTQGAELYCWSAGGSAYARKSAQECGLENCFTAFLPKPQIIIDDRTTTEWPRCVVVHPSQCSEESVPTYHRRLS